MVVLGHPGPFSLAKNKDLEADAWEIRKRAERKVGDLIATRHHYAEEQRKAGDCSTRQQMTFW